MKGLHFSSLDRTDPAVVARLQQAYVVGLDRMPWPSQIEWGNSTATVRRAISESGCLHLPWKVDGFGELYIQSSSLMERETPYSFPIEIARGQINKVRNQLADWELVGMKVPDEVVGTLKNAKGELLRAIRSTEPTASEKHAREALRWALWSAEGLTESYARRAIANRRRQRDRLPTRLGSVFDESFFTSHGKQVFRDVFNHITIPLRWNILEAQQGECDWESFDRVIDACTSAGLPFTVGPLLDMRAQSLPSWLWLWEDDIQTVVTLMMDMVETCIGRYRGKVKSWETTARTNSSKVFNLQEEQMLWLTGKMIEVVHNVDPEAEVVLTVDQPWGEYLAHDDRSYSPFTFVDTLIRNRVRISAINLEVAMGYAPGGSFCRTLLDFSQMLDRFHELAVPLRVRLFFPSEPASSKARENNPSGGGPLSTSAGRWRGPFSEAVQAEWAEKCILLAIAKPYIEVVTWGSYHDRADEATDWPASGLVDHAGRPKQTLDRIRKIRKAYVE